MPLDPVSPGGAKRAAFRRRSSAGRRRATGRSASAAWARRWSSRWGPTWYPLMVGWIGDRRRHVRHRVEDVRGPHPVIELSAGPTEFRGAVTLVDRTGVRIGGVGDNRESGGVEAAGQLGVSSTSSPAVGRN